MNRTRIAWALLGVSTALGVAVSAAADTGRCVPGQPCGKAPEPSHTGPTHRPNYGSATAVVDYYVVTLMYSPPGAGSTVSYGQTSSAGTITGFSEVSGQSTSVSVSAGVSAGPWGVSAKGSGSTGSSQQSSTSFTVQKSAGTTIALRSPLDALRHGQDVFEIWLHPKVHLYQNGPSSYDTIIDPPGPNDIVELSVNELLGVEPVPGYKQSALAALSRSDIQSILSADPFVTANQSLDTQRYVLLAGPGQSPMQLDGPDNPSDDTVPQGLPVTDSMTASDSHQETQTTTAGVGVTASGGFGLFKATVTANHQWTWSDSTSMGSSYGSSQTANVTLTSSTLRYHDLIDVYEDTRYHTFLFVSETSGNGIPPSEPPSVSGQATSGGRPLAHQLVTVRLADGSERRVFTNGQGFYRVFRAASGPAKIAIAGRTFDTRVVPRVGMRTDLHL